ncbi:MAG TPA: sigma-70 family RNA polymerase sigma factor [Vicinamibacterales bacterium]|jgi:RNA polymerase sigma-70 factor (ECF subfamily)|nr:sigma-70 family RNA polymerase sigma factor [Vicinamibacterales bacterium]
MMLSTCAPLEAVEADAALVRAKQGDAAAFEAILREHQSMVFSVAYHFAGDRAAAEDVAQDVFFELFRVIAQIDSTAHLVSWLRRVAVHRCIDRFRKRRFESPYEPAAMEPRTHDRPRDVLFDERIRREIQELPSHARAVMVLRFQEDLDPREIAEALGMPVNTVKSHIRRSVDVLRERLDVPAAVKTPAGKQERE